MLPRYEQQYVPVRGAMRFQRTLQTLPVIEADAYIDWQPKPYRSRLDGRERPDVVVELAGILFWQRRIGSKVASGRPKELAITDGSASARFKPWQFSCPNPPSGFSPWRTNRIVSAVPSISPPIAETTGIGKVKATTIAVLANLLQFQYRLKPIIRPDQQKPKATRL
jgi:hypothetical protein